MEKILDRRISVKGQMNSNAIHGLLRVLTPLESVIDPNAQRIDAQILLVTRMLYLDGEDPGHMALFLKLPGARANGLCPAHLVAVTLGDGVDGHDLDADALLSDLAQAIIFLRPRIELIGGPLGRESIGLEPVALDHH